MRLLIVEDNAALADALSSAFGQRNVHSDRASNAADAEQMVTTVDYTAMILDLGLPDEDGLALLRRLRGRQITLPIIVLTARAEGDMRVHGLESGADDYVVKPFLFAELHARLNAVLRRQGGFTDHLLRSANVTLDTRTREVTIDAQPIDLSSREIEILELLLRRVGHVVPKRMLEDQMFGAGDTLSSNAVEVYIHRIRRKLEPDAAVVVRTVRGIGYMLAPQ